MKTCLNWKSVGWLYAFALLEGLFFALTEKYFHWGDWKVSLIFPVGFISCFIIPIIIIRAVQYFD